MSPCRCPRWLLCAALGALLRAPAGVTAEEQRVLFLGNSFSFVSGGVWTQYKTIAEACIPGLHVTTTFRGRGAETLHEAGNDPATVSQVRGGGYDILVLQDQSELAEEGYEEVNKVFAPEAVKHHALLALYQTWATPPADGDNLTDGTLLRKQYYDDLGKIARKAGAQVAVARAGEAFFEVLRLNGFDWEFPGYRNLLAGDYDHPSQLGLNLVAWVMVLSWNAKRFSPPGCDPARVATIPGQSEEDKRTYARIACELAGVCSKTPAPTLPPLCEEAAHIQGEWVRKRRLPEFECQQEKQKGTIAGDCTYMEHWVVNGIDVKQISRGVEKSHTLRVSNYGPRLCFVKLLPEFSYVRKVTGTKVMFNDCQVWTRKEHLETTVPDECWCVEGKNWKDYEGDTCAAYETGQPKHGEQFCENTGEARISMFKLLRAKETCTGCGYCTPAPAAPAPAPAAAPAAARRLAGGDGTTWV